MLSLAPHIRHEFKLTRRVFLSGKDVRRYTCCQPLPELHSLGLMFQRDTCTEGLIPGVHASSQHSRSSHAARQLSSPSRHISEGEARDRKRPCDRTTDILAHLDRVCMRHSGDSLEEQVCFKWHNSPTLDSLCPPHPREVHTVAKNKVRTMRRADSTTLNFFEGFERSSSPIDGGITSSRGCLCRTTLPSHVAYVQSCIGCGRSIRCA
jgi:hypothetical protein